MHFSKMNFAYCQSSIDLGGEKEKLTEIKTSLPNYNIKKYLNHAIYDRSFKDKVIFASVFLFLKWKKCFQMLSLKKRSQRNEKRVSNNG